MTAFLRVACVSLTFFIYHSSLPSVEASTHRSWTVGSNAFVLAFPVQSTLEDLVRQLINTLQSSEDPLACLAAAKSLSGIGQPSVVPLIQFIKMTSGDRAWKVGIASRSLAAIRDPHAVAALLEAL